MSAKPPYRCCWCGLKYNDTEAVMQLFGKLIQHGEQDYRHVFLCNKDYEISYIREASLKAAKWSEAEIADFMIVNP